MILNFLNKGAAVYLKRLILSIFIGCSTLVASDMEWVKAYQQGGLRALENKVESIMQMPIYWNEMLKDKDTRFGYYENLNFLFIATKDAPTLKLYALENEKWEEKLNTHSLVGSKSGHKEREGDLATPIGVYTLEERLVNLDQYYGPLALTTNYPNLYDRLQKRTGSGIWIHGLPLDGNRKELNTRGCIAIENNLLTLVDQIVRHKEALLITYENTASEVKKEDLSVILADLYTWREAWKVSNVERYLSFYAPDFIRFDGMKLPEFSDNKRRIFARKEPKEIRFTHINISPYPNNGNRNFFRVAFFEDYKAPSYSFKGNKELFVEVKDSKMHIFMER